MTQITKIGFYKLNVYMHKRTEYSVGTLYKQYLYKSSRKNINLMTFLVLKCNFIYFQ